MAVAGAFFALGASAEPDAFKVIEGVKHAPLLVAGDAATWWAEAHAGERTKFKARLLALKG